MEITSNLVHNTSEHTLTYMHSRGELPLQTRTHTHTFHVTVGVENKSADSKAALRPLVLKSLECVDLL